MHLLTNFIQAKCGNAYLNIEDDGLFLSASSVVFDSVIHVMAWGKDSQNCIFHLIAMNAKDWEYWLANKRSLYGKVLLIANGGVENLKPGSDATAR